MKTRFYTWVLCMLGLMPALLNAQITTTNMFGTVTDKTGAVVPDAQVTATNTLRLS